MTRRAASRRRARPGGRRSPWAPRPAPPPRPPGRSRSATSRPARSTSTPAAPRGCAPGARLTLVRGGETVAEIEVDFVAEHSASCKVVSSTRPVWSGDRAVLVSSPGAAEGEAPATPTPAAPEPEVASEPYRYAAGAARRRAALGEALRLGGARLPDLLDHRRPQLDRVVGPALAAPARDRRQAARAARPPARAPHRARGLRPLGRDPPVERPALRALARLRSARRPLLLPRRAARGRALRRARLPRRRRSRSCGSAAASTSAPSAARAPTSSELGFDTAGTKYGAFVRFATERDARPAYAESCSAASPSVARGGDVSRDYVTRREPLRLGQSLVAVRARRDRPQPGLADARSPAKAARSRTPRSRPRCGCRRAGARRSPTTSAATT